MEYIFKFSEEYYTGDIIDGTGTIEGRILLVKENTPSSTEWHTVIGDGIDIEDETASVVVFNDRFVNMLLIHFTEMDNVSQSSFYYGDFFDTIGQMQDCAGEKRKSEITSYETIPINEWDDEMYVDETWYNSNKGKAKREIYLFKLGNEDLQTIPRQTLKEFVGKPMILVRADDNVEYEIGVAMNGNTYVYVVDDDAANYIRQRLKNNGLIGNEFSSMIQYLVQEEYNFGIAPPSITYDLINPQFLSSKIVLIQDYNSTNKQSKKVLCTLATGQSDITRHEAYTKAQGLNEFNSLNPQYF